MWPMHSPRKRRASAAETVWPYFYAGTMGLVQRDGIQRLRHAMKYSRWFSTICVTLSDSGWIAGVGSKRGVDLREAAEHADLVVIWGGNPVNTQVNVMQHAMAAKKRGAKLVVVDPYRTGTAEKADLHLAARARHRRCARLRCHARAVRRRLRRLGLSAPPYRLPRRAGRARARRAHRSGPPRSPACRLQTIVEFARLYGRTRRSLHSLPSRLLALAQRRGEHARGRLPARRSPARGSIRAAARSTATPASIRSTAR